MCIRDSFIPYKPDVPAIIIELKKDDTVDAAISQIRERRYPEALEKYRENLLLVAITYDSKTKEHRARIEKAHTEACSIQKYNNEGSFQSALHCLLLCKVLLHHSE